MWQCWIIKNLCCVCLHYTSECYSLAACRGDRDTCKKDCMLQRCTNCPDLEIVKQHLKEKFEDEEIFFEQWELVDQTELITQMLLVSEYIQTIFTELTASIPHHFTSHAQSSYLKCCKENMDQRTAPILINFADCYSFHV